MFTIEEVEIDTAGKFKLPEGIYGEGNSGFEEFYIFRDPKLSKDGIVIIRSTAAEIPNLPRCKSDSSNYITIPRDILEQTPYKKFIPLPFMNCHRTFLLEPLRNRE